MILAYVFKTFKKRNSKGKHIILNIGKSRKMTDSNIGLLYSDVRRKSDLLYQSLAHRITGMFLYIVYVCVTEMQMLSHQGPFHFHCK